jgi:methylated-DNA-[protein]-cysteine S-methyltransferase
VSRPRETEANMNVKPVLPMNDNDAAAWLGDGDGPARQPDALLAALDALYLSGPDPAATEQAQSSLRQALARGGRATADELFYDVLPGTPIGTVMVAVGPRGLVAVRLDASEAAFVSGLRRTFGVAPVRSAARAGEAARQVREYLQGTRLRFDLPVDLSAATDFQRRVLLAAAGVPRGEVTTYADIARRIGRPRAARAVGQALSRNPVPVVVPCHRVLAADGSLRGYLGGSGVAAKLKLLQLEGARPAA